MRVQDMSVVQHEGNFVRLIGVSKRCAAYRGSSGGNIPKGTVMFRVGTSGITLATARWYKKE
jgi:hypothetical protein